MYFLSEELPDIDSFNEIHPHFDDDPLSGSTTYSANSLLEEFADELALISYPPDYDDTHQSVLTPCDDLFVDPIPEMFTEEQPPDYSFLPRFDVYPDDFLEIKSDATVDDDSFDSEGEKIKEAELLIGPLDLPCDILSEYDSFNSQDFSRDDVLFSPDNEDKCGDSLSDFFCHQCTCEFCGNGAHDGYNCPSHCEENLFKSSFDEEIISMDPHHFNAESDLIESLLNHNSSIISSSSKIDSLLDEFAGELILLKTILPGIDETDGDPEEEIRLIEKLLYDNSSPQFDLSFTPDDSMPLGIVEDDYDSSFHFDIPSSYRPLAKPSDDDSGILTVKMVGNISRHDVPMPKLLPTQPPSFQIRRNLLISYLIGVLKLLNFILNP
nr:hypothetical protein [Tanacetum cinerariifolium]